MLVSVDQDGTHGLRLMHNGCDTQGTVGTELLPCKDASSVSVSVSVSLSLSSSTTSASTPEQASNADETSLESGWFPLHNVLWRSTAAQVKNGLSAEVLSVPWQLSLFGDGSTLYHLELVTKQNINVRIIDLSEQNDIQPDFEPLADVLPKPWIRRQIFLETEETKEKVIYASSWWNSEYSKTLMKDETKPVWSNLHGLDVFRDFRGIIFGNNPSLEEMFGVTGPFWARFYLLWHRGHPLCLIYEVYSNVLEAYLGPSLATPEKLSQPSFPQ